MSGDAICTAATITLATSYIESGDMVPIAMFSNDTYSFEGYENVPALPDLGYDVTLPSYNFLITRAGVPDEDVAAMYQMFLDARDSDNFKEQAEAASYIDPTTANGADMEEHIAHYAEFCEYVFNTYY